MRVDLGDYVITSDEFNIILNTRHVTKEGKRVGTEYLKPIGYYSNFYTLFQKLLTLEITKSDLTSIQDLSNKLGALALNLSNQLHQELRK